MGLRTISQVLLRAASPDTGLPTIILITDLVMQEAFSQAVKDNIEEFDMEVRFMNLQAAKLSEKQRWSLTLHFTCSQRRLCAVLLRSSSCR